MAYKCFYCSRTFASPYALKRHISDKHQYIEDEGEASSSRIPFDEPGLWDDDITMEEAEQMTSEPTIEQPYIEPYEDPRFSEKSDKESDEETNDNLTYPLYIDPEDYRGTTLDDAVNDKLHPPNTEWPNDIYREFMEIVMEYQLSNSCGDRIIKLIGKCKGNLNEDILPKNTK